MMFVSMIFVLLAGLLLIALFFILISLILLVIRQIKKRKGKMVKKRWLVIPIVILIFGIILSIVPIGVFSVVRFINNATEQKIVYAESGKMLNWPMGDFESTWNYFELDGTKYVMFDGLYEIEDKLGKPIANIRSNPADKKLFNEFMTFLLTGNTTDKLNVSTLYPIINENKFELIEVSGPGGGGVYCPDSKLNSIKTYYEDISNYDTQNLTVEYSVYTDKKDNGERNGNSFIDIKKNILLKQKVFEEICQASDVLSNRKYMEIPNKYLEIEEAAKPGTPIRGFESRRIYAYSKDKLTFKSIELILIEGQVYIEFSTDSNSVTGIPLSYDLNKYILDTVFAD